MHIILSTPPPYSRPFRMHVRFFFCSNISTSVRPYAAMTVKAHLLPLEDRKFGTVDFKEEIFEFELCHPASIKTLLEGNKQKLEN